MYQSMEERVENVVKSGSISHDYITKEEESEALSRWTEGFLPQNHPPVVQVSSFSSWNFLLSVSHEQSVRKSMSPHIYTAHS